MKVSSLTFFLSTLALAAAKSPLEYEQEFAAWLTAHNLAFSEPLEYIRRMETFVANDIFIREHNANANASFTLGHNEFSHLTFDEFAQRKKGFAMPPGYLDARLAATPQLRSASDDAAAAPESVDWVAKGAVTDVKNQGQCGSCWAFSTTGAVEGAAFVSSGKLPNLSEQELVDCDHNGDHGCNGGLMDHAFQWIHEQGGICAESEYEYHGALEQCHACKQVVSVSGFVDVAPNDEAALRAAVAKQPVSVAIEADQREFQFYKSGVFDLTCGTQLDHGVLAVGYGVEEDGKKFWKVKNSWGATWGEGGYIRLARELGPAAGQCGIAMVPSYPHASWTSATEEANVLSLNQQQQQEEQQEQLNAETALEADMNELLELAVKEMALELVAEEMTIMLGQAMMESELLSANELSERDVKVYEFEP